MPLGHYEPIPSGPVELPPFSYGGELAPHVPQDDAPIAGPSEPSTSATTLDVDVDADPPPLTPARGRGSRGGRGVRGGKRKRTTKPSVAEPEKDDGDGEDDSNGENGGEKTKKVGDDVLQDEDDGAGENGSEKAKKAAEAKAKADKAVALLKEVTGKEPLFVQLDLADLSSVKKAAEEFLSKEPELHILFCNA